MIQIIKKDGTLEAYNPNKIINACKKAAMRALDNLNDNDYQRICENVMFHIKEQYPNEGNIPVSQMHSIVEKTLMELYPNSGEAYRQYRNYKVDFVRMLDDVYQKSQTLRYIGDVSNANTDSTMVSTQRSLIYGQLNKNLYQKFFLNKEERQATNDGYIYIHDMKDRLDGMNCFRRDTKFITKDGVKSFYDFSDGDETMVLSHKGIWRRAVIHKYGWQPIQKVTLAKGTPTSKPIEIYCTKDHRWILKDGSETTNLSIGDILWQVPDIAEFEWDDLSLENKKLWCKGFARGDGSLIGGRDKNRPDFVVLELCGDKIKYAQRFEDCGYTVTDTKGIVTNKVVYMLDQTTKEVPLLQLNHTNVLYYINGLMCADGNRTTSENASSEFRGIQVTGKLNECIYDLLNMSGYFVSSTRDLTDTETNYGKRSDITINYQVSSTQNRTSAWRVKDIQPEKLNPHAEVWCLDVEIDHSFILEGGIPTGNCCLFNMANVLQGGFEMGNVWYNEPKTLDVAFDVISDVAMSAASQQYGGFTIPRVDTIIAPYAEKSYKKYCDEYKEIAIDNDEDYIYAAKLTKDILNKKADEYAMKKVYRDMEQGFQSWEYRFNTVGSSRGDYPFVAISFGIGQSKFERMATEVALKVRKNGQGKKGHKKPVLFPKLTFLYDENLHGEGKKMEYLFDLALQCSSKTMYPDFLSLTGEGYIPSIYKKYGQVISLMGCRASLSPWYVRGGMNPADDEDYPIFEGRFNLGAISLHLPMILAKARQENKNFYEVLDYYLEMIRNLHRRTYDFFGEKLASTNPLAFTQGGFLGGNLKPNDKVRPILKACTMSFGITALNELQELYNGKSLVEDGEFALEVMKYINDYISRIKSEDGILYAIYGTPAESLCGLQIEQFRKIYGVVKGVSDRAYVSNSFHCGVWEDITPIQKQDLEKRFWDYFNGGKIQYCRYPVSYNHSAQKTLVRRAMDMGFYEGCNLALSYCEDCGYEQLEMDICPKCGSTDITQIDRMNGLTA